MGFISNLGKGFIRSAVNQVGRDGGKVISNKIYGDAHATPIRGVRMNPENQYYDESSSEVLSSDELRKRGEAEGFQISVCQYKITTKIAWYFCALLFSWSIVPAIILFIKGIQKLRQKSIYMYNTVTAANYVSDKRYRNGKRLNGYSQEIIKIKIPATNIERNKLINVGIVYLLLSFSLFYFGFSLWNYSNANGQTEKEIYDKQSTEIDSIINAPF